MMYNNILDGDIKMNLTKEKNATLTIRLPLELRENLKIKVACNKTTMANVILKYLKEYVNE